MGWGGSPLGRGLLASLALLPLLAGLEKGSPLIGTWLRLSLSLGVTSGILPMLSAPGWPARLRIAHGIEISVFSLAQGFAWSWFLCR